jgi:hypothetical protein
MSPPQNVITSYTWTLDFVRHFGDFGGAFRASRRGKILMFSRGNAMTRSEQIYAVKAAVMMTAASMLLTACAVTCPTTVLGTAARYLDDATRPSPWGDQFNRWVANARLDHFLQQTVRWDGVSALSKKHGLHCAAQPGPDNCRDCYLCTGTIIAEVYDLGGTFGGAFCRAYGTISIRAEIGPADAATSMTYWVPAEKTPRK